MASSYGIQRGLVRGALFTLIGGGAAYMATDYGVGTATTMGAGYFPLLVGGLLALMGVAEIVRSVLADASPPMPTLHLWPVACLACGVVGFGLLIDGGGLLLAVAVLVGFAFLARKRFNPLEAALIFVVLAALSGSLFVLGLGSPLSYLLPH